MRPEEIVGTYDRVAPVYRERFERELDDKPSDRFLLDGFATKALPGAIADIGSGPGQIGAYLAAKGLRVAAIDISIGMLREALPAVSPVAGDYFFLPLRTGVLGGAVAFYSVIHAPRERVADALAEIRRACVPGAPFLLSLHAGEGHVRHEQFLGHGVPVAATLFEVAEVGDMLRSAGWTIDMLVKRAPYESEGSERIYASATA